MRSNILFTMLFLGWTVFVTFSSLISFQELDTPGLLNIPHMDKLVHFTFYFVMGSTLALAVRERTKGRLDQKKVMMISLFFSIIYGMFMEIMQYALTTDRHGDVLDALANTVGAFAGIAVIAVMFSGKYGLKWKF